VGEKLSRRKIRQSAISILGQCVFYRYGRLVLAKTEGRVPKSPTAVQRIADHIHEFSLMALTKSCEVDAAQRQSRSRRRQNGNDGRRVRRTAKRQER
jgi:hypothetical protein